MNDHTQFEEWLPHEGVVATRKINAPCLLAGNKILAVGSREDVL